MKPIIDRNPRNTGKRKYRPKLLKKKRYIVEQFNAIFKNALDESWKRFKGLIKKTSTVYCMLIAINIKAIGSVISGSGLREVSEYWY